MGVAREEKMKGLGTASILALLLSSNVAFSAPTRAQVAAAEPAGDTRPSILAPEQLRVAYVCFYNGEETRA